MIYTVFKISISEREKEIASLSSIGATKWQIFKIYFIEIIVIMIIGIPIGLLISTGIDFVLVNALNNLFKNIQIDIITGQLVNSASVNVDLYLVNSFSGLLISIVLIIITILLSVLIPIINISKTTILERLRKSKYNKINEKTVKVPKLITKLFKAPGDLAYKNVKRSRSKYVAMILSLTISIVMFMSVTGYIANIGVHNKLDISDYNYSLYVYTKDGKTDYSSEVLKTLKELGLIDNVYGKNNLNLLFQIIQNDNINPSLKKALSRMERLTDTLDLIEDGSIELTTVVETFDNDTYNKYLKQLGKNIELKQNECILVNYFDAKTKYFDGIYLTNYKEGDKLTLNTKQRNNEFVDEMLNQFANTIGGQVDNVNEKLELTIKTISNILPNGTRNDINNCEMYIIVNPETFGEIFEQIHKVQNSNILEYYIQSSNPNDIDTVIKELNVKYNEYAEIQGINFSEEQQRNINEKNIKEIILYSFLVLIGILSIINVFNIIISNIKLRKSEIAELIAIGMSKKQLRKMLILEGIFYGISSVIIGGVISTVILYVLYANMIDIELYTFSFPWLNFITSIIIVYIVIFISIGYARKQMNKEDISQLIKEKI